jgi:NAD(P) transhydrogenase
VTLIEGRTEVLGFLDREITEALMYQMRRAGITLRLGEKVSRIEAAKPAAPPADAVAAEPLVQAILESGKTIRAQTLLYAVGRQGTTGALQLDKAGLIADDRERLRVDAFYRTKAEHIYAVGDVIGFPALASTAMEQGRLAACHAYGVPTCSIPELFPYGVYAIPEISMVGRTEDQLTKAGIPYEAGIAQYKELARGQLLGDEDGMLKLLIHQETREILGVHAIGTGATELIHIGQAVMAYKGTVEFFINTVFNYPTLAEAYKVAALNGLNKLRNI